MRYFRNASIFLKLLIAPVLSALITAGAIAVFYVSYVDITRSAETKEAAARLAAGIDATTLNLLKAHGTLYRAASLKNEGVEDAVVDRERAASGNAMREAKRLVLELKEHPGELDAAAVDQTAKAVNAYIAVATQAVDMIAEDVFTAMMFMNNADRLYAAAEKDMAGLVAALTAARRTIDAEAARLLRNALYQVSGGIAAAVLLSFLLSVILGRAIAVPIKGLTAVMGRLAGGDLQAALPATDRKDEIGAMAMSVQVFKDNMVKAAQLESEQKGEQAKKEARAKTVEGYITEFDQSVASVLEMVSSASTELQSTAQSMSATAEETSRQATAVAAASEQASTNVQTVASAAEELSSSIAEISRQVSESAKIAGQASEQAATTNAQINGLAEAAQRIGDVVKLINDIASQTNLLALNATIEAARAGEAGKGFAVVASEVKSLANQTAKATEEISAKIAEMQAATGESVHAISTITQTIGRINEIATTIASAVEEQGAATQEIARNVQQASAGTAEVSSNIGGVTKAATDTGAAASQVLGSSGELSKQSETLRNQVDGFLRKIRST